MVQLNQSNGIGGQFPIHVYRKEDLAMLYFPENTKKNATNCMRRWIKSCPGLYEDLEKVGYYKSRKFFTAPEVQVIVKYFGRPWIENQ